MQALGCLGVLGYPINRASGGASAAAWAWQTRPLGRSKRATLSTHRQTDLGTLNIATTSRCRSQEREPDEGLTHIPCCLLTR